MSKSILIVEDEDYMRDVLKNWFEREGFKIFQAKDGSQGLKTALSKHPDMIILDILMPVMDGVAMLRELRNDVWGEKANVILLTNIGDGPKLEEAMSLGALACMLKAEWSMNEIAVKIKEILGGK